MMSKSTLWTMDNQYNGIEIEEYGNGLLFAPTVWDILFEKYVSKNEPHSHSFMNYSLMDKNKRVNEKVNNSTNQVDRLVWELSQQQIFHTKDKELVAYAVKNFLKINYQYSSEFKTDNIPLRFSEIAKDIHHLNARTHPYFFFKNTSVDDEVMNWFREYNIDTSEYDVITLDKSQNRLTEFVVIEDKKIQGFINNLDFFKSRLVDNK